jgi:alpha-aminoadipic semialdehyde synthase
MMFSHTVKGQPYNTPLLARFLASPGSSAASAELLPRLVDYELLTDEASGKRTVGFGWFAGGTCFALKGPVFSHPVSF